MPGNRHHRMMPMSLRMIRGLPRIATRLDEGPKLRNCHWIVGNVVAWQSEGMLRLFIVIRQCVVFFITPHLERPCWNLYKAHKWFVRQVPGIGAKKWIVQTGNRLLNRATLLMAQTASRQEG